MKSGWIEHKNKKIFFAKYCDFGTDLESLKAEVEECDRIILAQPRKSVLLLCDFHNTTETSEIKAYIKKSAAKTNINIKKIAALRVYGLRLVIMKAIALFIDMPIQAFEDIEKAKDWLVQD
ncbi:MAG: hypothetical protein ABIG64_07835 [Candidatus Omnitrophota bacterium]